MERRDREGVWDGHVLPAVFKMDSQQGPTLQHMELCSVLCGSLEGEEFGGRMNAYVCVCVCVCVCVSMAESLCCSPGIVTTLFVNQLCPRTKINFKNK